MVGVIEQFHWLRPQWLLLLIPAVMLVAYLLSRKSNQQQWQKAIDPQLLPYLLNNKANIADNRISRLPTYLLAALYAIGILALAGPTWQKLPQPSVQLSQPMIVIADLTLSMHADDLPPSRLIRMRYKLLELMKQRSEGQTALIAYSGDAHVVSPLTDDANTIAALIPSLTPEIMPSIGSNAAAAMSLVDTLSENIGGNIKLVWFTDEALSKDVDALKSLMKRRNYELFIVGIGTQQGGPIRLPSGKFLQDNRGQTATVKLDENQLRATANKLGGVYFPLQNDNTDIARILADSKSLYDDVSDANGQSDSHQSRAFDNWVDRGAWLCWLMIPIILPLFRRGLFTPCLLFLVLCSTDPVQAQAPSEANENASGTWRWQDLWQTRDQQAALLHQRGDYAAAAERFKNEEWRAASLYDSQRYDQAAGAFSQQLQHGDGDARHRARQLYNNGHALARSGQLEQAISNYQQALKLDPDFVDAQSAKEIVEQLLRQQSQQQSSQQQSQPQSGEPPEQHSSQQNDQSQSHSSYQSQDQTQDRTQNQESSQDQNTQNQSNDAMNSSAENDQQRDSENRQQQSATQSEQHAGDSEKSDDVTSIEDTTEAAQHEGVNEEQQVTANAALESLSAQEKAQLEQWLNKIKDDPGGLLRRKFQYQRQLKEQQGQVIETDEQGNIW